MSQISLKTVCCTCLSTDRKLYRLCRILDGVNLLYMLLTLDPEAYKAGFYKETSCLFVCWECRAAIHRIKRFQVHACISQTHLTSIADGRNDIKLQTFTRLSCTRIVTPNYEFQFNDVTAENFVDCGPVKEIKTESDSDDLPLSAFCYENNSEDELGNLNFEPGNYTTNPSCDTTNLNNDTEPGNVNIISKNEFSSSINLNTIPIRKSSKLGDFPLQHGNTTLSNNIGTPQLEEIDMKKRTKIKYRKYYAKSMIDEKIRLANLEKRKMDLSEAVYKCDKCIIEFKTEEHLTRHKADCHEKKDNQSQCDICHSYTEELHTHRQTHYQSYSCVLCTHIADTHVDIVSHLKRNHREICSGKNKRLKRKRSGCSEEISKYPCPECELSFLNKDLRWKHIQKAHREGYKCNTCDKKFAFKNNLERHERIHKGPLPREECPTCRKMIRIDLLKVHSRIHADRQTHSCVECNKTFVSRATYESHLKYAQAHASGDVCRHKCPSCHKRYRSRGELRDHINYNHKGRAEHKCPICGKGLATKRCIRRHVRRAHEGIKESAKDKICQQCGKAFRDKKGLVEHERVHSGARPLACAACGRAFRQRAALRAHARRLHPPDDAGRART